MCWPVFHMSLHVLPWPVRYQRSNKVYCCQRRVCRVSLSNPSQPQFSQQVLVDFSLSVPVWWVLVLELGRGYVRWYFYDDILDFLSSYFWDIWSRDGFYEHYLFFIYFYYHYSAFTQTKNIIAKVITDTLRTPTRTSPSTRKLVSAFKNVLDLNNWLSVL